VALDADAQHGGAHLAGQDAAQQQRPRRREGRAKGRGHALEQQPHVGAGRRARQRRARALGHVSELGRVERRLRRQCRARRLDLGRLVKNALARGRSGGLVKAAALAALAAAVAMKDSKCLSSTIEVMMSFLRHSDTLTNQACL
jgi:hypothetical protein